MHDWTLKKIELDWASASLSMELVDTTSTKRTLAVSKIHEIHIPKKNEWGPSVNINSVSEIEILPSGLHCLKIEMQSGDVINIVAELFSIPTQD